MPETLLRTKLFRPPVRPNLVPRTHLIKQLDQGLQNGHKLTVISAPAGFGKTTLVSEWVAGCKCPVAWLSLDAGDNEPTRFLAYLVAALQTVAIHLGDGVLGALQSPQPPLAEPALTTLINDIAAFPDRFILVFDDYHLIDTAAIDDAFAFLIERLPPQIHLVVATRNDPPLPLARLRARGQLTELRAADLRFTFAEAARFLNEVMDLDLTEADISALEARTEGWIAGLQLAAIALQGSLARQGRAAAAHLIDSFSGSHRFVLDYLIEEVLERQPAYVQDFLLQTAVLERLTGPLCDAVRFGTDRSLNDQDRSQEILEMLERTNLFIVPLDDERRWYRYHHLFADLLRQRLEQTHREQMPALHKRASEWYEQHALIPDAIHHALAATDFERVADLAELAWPAWSGVVQLITWLSWVNELPEKVVRVRPVLGVAYAQSLLNVGELEAAEARLLEIERWMAPTNDRLGNEATKMVVVDEAQVQSLPATLATTRAYHAQAIGDAAGTVKYTQQVLDLLPAGEQLRRGQVTALLGLAQWANGDLEAAYHSFSTGIAATQQDGHIPDSIDTAFVLAEMKMALGHLHEAVEICERALQLVADAGLPMLRGSEDVYTVLSKLHREQGDLDAATQDLAASKQRGEQVEVPDWQSRWCIAQSQLAVTLGDLDGALDLLNEAERLYVRTPLPEVQPIAAMKARVWIAQGKLPEALDWVRERGLSVNDALSYLREFEHITLAKVLIAGHKSGRRELSIHDALALLTRLLQAAEEAGRMGSAIEILVLRALAHDADSSTSAALVSLERALILAEPQGYLRLFVDEGLPMARLLYQTLSQDIAPDYVRRLLAAVPDTEPEQVVPANTQSSTPIEGSAQVEALSEREVEVLHLIAAGLTNKEIAARLYLSLHTVKGHARHIYGKLGVNNRTKAVAKGKALGILPPIIL